MARRTVTVIYDLDTAQAEAALYGGDTVDAGAVRREAWSRVAAAGLTPGRRKRGRHTSYGTVCQWEFALKPVTETALATSTLTMGDYSTTTPGVVRQQLRGGGLVKEWASIELAYEAPAGTTVQVRLRNADDDALYWNGAAWVAAGNNWNTPGDLEANFASLTVTGSPRCQVTVEWRMSTSNNRVTPVVLGAVIVARLVFGSRSGSTVAETGSDSWMDDVIHRTLIPWFMTNLAPEVTDERVAQTPTQVLDYSAGIGTSPYSVVNVSAVYDLATDPNMLTPLAGSWDAGTKRYTLNAPIGAGVPYAARVVYAPAVVYTGGRHYFTDTLPQVVIEDVSAVGMVPSPRNWYVRNAPRTHATVVRRAADKEFRITVLLQSDHQVTAFDLAESVERALQGNMVRLVSANTGFPITLAGRVELRPARGDTDIAGAARFDLIVLAETYIGAETTTALLKQLNGFIFNVGVSQGISTQA